jgi:uncharacterized secreted protein with C-terminal beta-propeller domain
MRLQRHGIVGLTLGIFSLAFVGCTPGALVQHPGPQSRMGPIRLVAYDSCDAATTSLRAAARMAVARYVGAPISAVRGGMGQNQSGVARSAAGPAPGAAVGAEAGAASSTATAVPDYSGTNVHEVGVDEPDIVKTDGSRILTLSNGMLHVVDAASRRITGEVSLPGRMGAPSELLLRGDWALVLFPSTSQLAPVAWAGPQANSSDVVLVDLSGQAPRLAGALTVDGSLIDARQMGGEAWLVVRSAPRLDAANPAAIDMATISDWQPRFSLSVDGRTKSGRVDCRRISRPSQFSALTMLTVYSLDLDAPSPSLGEPATVVADGSVVYGNGSSLYIAADDRWMAPLASAQMAPAPGAQMAPNFAPVHTQIYKFDVSEPGRPMYAASGEVPGSLLNQYAMSEYNGKLRVVTTTTAAPAAVNRASSAISSSAVSSFAISDSGLHVLQQRGEDLTEIGQLAGLGRGERVYSVRFVGTTAYVVTFRQTDPLYVVDISDPANPAAVGELQLTGYSAYLHPAGDGLLIGVGQEANARGRVLGTQVSLFKVSDPSRPELLGRYQLNGGVSEAEVDPHAFLFWPKTGLVLIPVTPSWNGALALTIDGASIHGLGRVGPGRAIRRSLVIGDTLWTVSDAGLGANHVTTLAAQGWIPFSMTG